MRASDHQAHASPTSPVPGAADATAYPGNGLLSVLPVAETERLLARMRTVHLRAGRVLVEPGSPVELAYFPVTAVISMLTVVGNGSSIEAALVGQEGVASLEATTGMTVSPWRLLVQASGDALVIEPRTLADLLPRMPGLSGLVMRHAHVMQQLATQSVACNRFHSAPERLARWLLMMLDRIEGNRLETTHDMLAQMIGAYRPTVTLALLALAQQGLVEPSRRGQVVVTDRAGLEAGACECYAVATQALADERTDAAARAATAPPRDSRVRPGRFAYGS